MPGKTREDPAYLTFGGDYFDQKKHFNSSKNEIIAHRISGSFHWEVHLIKFQVGKNKIDIYPSVHSALTDTGTNSIIMPPKDYKAFIDSFCE